MKSIIEIFENLEDERDNRGKKHKLIDIIIMSIYAMMCGNTDSENIADWLYLRKDYFTQDGKAIKSVAKKKSIPYIVSAYLMDIGLSFCQVKTDDKSNEITAIPELIEILDIKDSIISIDAIGTQKDIVSKIIQKEGHYCLNLKENHKTMYHEVKEYFDYTLKEKEEVENMLQFQTKSFGHERIETRKYYVVKDISFITNKKDWKNLKNVCLVINKRESKGNTSIEHKYYITDLDISAEKLAQITRGHWQIENNLHWILDIHFREDWSKTKKGNSIQNIALLRKICYNLIKLDDSFGNISFKKKLNRYNYDFSLLDNLIFNVIPHSF